MKLLLASILSLMTVPCFAQSDADVLLDHLGEKPVQQNTKATHAVETASQFRGGDAFQQQLWIQIEAAHKVPFDVKSWSQLVLDGGFTQAAHLWTAIQTQIPPGLRHEADATQLYLLWKLGLNQTFFDQWVRALANASYAESNAEHTLETLVTPHLDAWLLKSGVIVDQKSETIVNRLAAEDEFVLTLKAWANLRNPKVAAQLLPSMLAKNKLTPYLANTVIYDLVRRDDLKGAARTLKSVIEPVINASKDLELLASHDLAIARILYQAGQMKAAGQFYKKIPNRSPDYLDAREELSWVYLRLNDMSDLRGEIKALNSPLFKDRFQPESYLLRAVSDLKMCFYDLLDKDLKDFSQANSTWAKRIDQALAASTPPPPDHQDQYTRLSATAVKNLEGEMAHVKDLAEKSIGATLPAVGPQKHWKDYQGQLLTALSEARKREADEYTRQWKNRRSALQEAIRKMRFVKVEYESQIRQLAGDSPATGKLVASNSDSLPAAKVAKTNEDQLSFPATSEVWSDELFKLRSAAQANCLKKAGGK